MFKQTHASVHKLTSYMEGRTKERKRQTTPDWQIIVFISKGTYAGGLSWMAARQADLCPCLPEISSSYRGLN